MELWLQTDFQLNKLLISEAKNLITLVNREIYDFFHLVANNSI